MTNDPVAYEREQQEEIAICVTCQTPYELCDGMRTRNPAICPLVSLRRQRAVKKVVSTRNNYDHDPETCKCPHCKSARILKRARAAYYKPMSIAVFAKLVKASQATVRRWVNLGYFIAEMRDVPKEQRAKRGQKRVMCIVGLREDGDGNS